MKKHPEEGTLREIPEHVTIHGKSYVVSEPPAAIEIDAGSYTISGLADTSCFELEEPAPTLYDLAGRPIEQLSTLEIKDSDGIKVTTGKNGTIEIIRTATESDSPGPSGIVKDGIELSATFKSEVKKKPQGKQGRITLPPGHLLRDFVNLAYSKKIAERVLLPTITDMQKDWMDANPVNCPWKARWVTIRGYWTFLKVIGLQGVVSIIKRIFDAWKVL